MKLSKLVDAAARLFYIYEVELTCLEFFRRSWDDATKRRCALHLGIFSRIDLVTGKDVSERFLCGWAPETDKDKGKRLGPSLAECCGVPSAEGERLVPVYGNELRRLLTPTDMDATDWTIYCSRVLSPRYLPDDARTIYN